MDHQGNFDPKNLSHIMRVLSLLALFLSVSFFAQAQDESDKTLVKTLKNEGAYEVVIDFDASDINAEPWDNQTFRIQMKIEANVPIPVLEQLVKAGRYDLTTEKKDGKYYVTAPNIEKHISVKGKDLEDKIHVQVQTPGYYALSENSLVLGEDIVARARSAKNAEEILKPYAVQNVEVSDDISLATTLKSNPDIKLKKGDIIIYENDADENGTALEIK